MMSAIVPKKRGRKPKNGKLSRSYLAYLLTLLFIDINSQNGEGGSQALATPTQAKGEGGPKSLPKSLE